MPKNFKKLFVCIVATFGITAIVFSCCKKIGLAASDSTFDRITFDGFPIPFGNGLGTGGFSFDGSSLFNALCSDSHINFTPDGILFYEKASDDSYITVILFKGHIFNDSYIYYTSTDSTFNNENQIHFDTDYRALFNVYTDGTISYVRTDDNQYTCRLSLHNFAFNDSYYYYSTDGILFMPMYFSNQPTFNYSNHNNSGLYAFDVYSSFSSHSKGGVLSNYIDSYSLIENNSDLPTVDTTPPSDPGSNSGWFQKILNGLGKINQSIKGGVLTIGDFIGSGFEKVGEWFQDFKDSVGGFFDRVQDSFDDIIDTIEGLKDGSTVAHAQATWQDEFNNSIFKDFVDLKGSIEDDILTPIRNANAPSTLSFTIPLIKVNVPSLVNNGGSVSTATNNVYLFGQSVTLDFSWYTRSISGGVFNGSSIRDYLVPIIATFLYVTMVVHLLFKIPSFLNGSSGFSDTLHTVVVSFNGSKFKKA